MKNTLFLTTVSVAAVLVLSGCGGSSDADSPKSAIDNIILTNSDGESLSVLTRGFALPTEISAVPTVVTPSNKLKRKPFSSVASTRSVSDLVATTDYQSTQTQKFVEERDLEQFDIIEQVLSAIGQTHYADEGNVNQGPYTAMISWVENEDGREVKTLQPWVVDSRMIVIDSVDVNRVLAWIEEPDWDNPGQMRLIKAEFKIYQAATVNDDGSFADYGEWDLNVNFNDATDRFFVANSRILNGENIIKIQEAGMGDGGGMKGILVRSGAEGYGQVSYPDWDWCRDNASGPNCSPPNAEAQYAYNADYLAIDADSVGIKPVVFKDRNPANAVEMTHRYGLFYNETPPQNIAPGTDVEKQKSFGFPVAFTDSTSGVDSYAYYGAWQGRHELWSDAPNGLAAGTTVTREGGGENQPLPAYVVSDKFEGTFTKRSLTEGDLGDIQGIAVETWINKNYDLFWDETQNLNAGAWMYCDGFIEWIENTQTFEWDETCVNHDGTPSVLQSFDDFSSLVVSDNDRKWVGIGGGFDQESQLPIEYVYLNTDPGNGAIYTIEGFYPATFDEQTGQLVAATGASVLTPNKGDHLWVDIGGSIYISYTGDFSNNKTGWVEKTLASFEDWVPVFSDGSDVAFSPEVGREYYINNNGANLVVKRKVADDLPSSYDVMVELQSAANPVNVASFIPAGVDYFRTPWDREVRFNFVTVMGSNFLKLVYANDDLGTDGVDETGTIYTDSAWGLQGYAVGNDGIAGTLDDQPLKINDDGSVVAIAVDDWGFSTEVDPALRPTEFNWEYSQEGWGTQQFLCSPDCTAIANYLILSDPIQFAPLTVPNGAGVDKTLSLRFDGWTHGLPDLYFELSKNNWQMSQNIRDKIINIPAGTAVVDDAGVGYYIKPLEISVFLAEVPDTTAGLPDVSTASVVDLDTVPGFIPHGMGLKPMDTTVKYSEGQAVD